MSFSDVMDANEWLMAEKGAFEKDTQHRLVVEAARYWVIENYLRTGRLPDEATYYAYATGPHGFDWGNPPGPGDQNKNRPLRGKRVRITFSIEPELLTGVVRFTRENSWPCEVKPDTPPEDIETRTVLLTETRVKDGVEVYDMVCGHGTTITLPVHKE